MPISAKASGRTEQCHQCLALLRGFGRVEALEPLPLTALSERAGAAKRGPWRGHRLYSANQVPRLSDTTCNLWNSTVRTTSPLSPARRQSSIPASAHSPSISRCLHPVGLLLQENTGSVRTFFLTWLLWCRRFLVPTSILSCHYPCKPCKPVSAPHP